MIDHKKLSRKWARLVASAQKNRSKAKKDARATGGGPASVRMNQEFEHILSAADANADLPSTTDCEPDQVLARSDDDMFEDDESQSVLQSAQNALDTEVADIAQALNFAPNQQGITRMDEFSQSNAAGSSGEITFSNIHGKQLIWAFDMCRACISILCTLYAKCAHMHTW